jgi:hypothetical protein
MNKFRALLFFNRATRGTHRFAVRNETVLMCDKCVELDKKIERYRMLSSAVADQLTIDRIKELIADLLAQKTTLHPEQEE